MPKRQKPANEFLWRISLIKGTPAAEIGTVTAPRRGERHREGDQRVSDTEGATIPPSSAPHRIKTRRVAPGGFSCDCGGQRFRRRRRPAAIV
jgi:hypothetical protein